MNTLLSGHSAKQRIATLLAGALLLVALLASLGAGPDEPRASNVNNDWEIFEGHAYADNRAAPAGVALVACLGGCELGYVTPSVITGADGIYQVKVAPGQARPDGRMVTFWLIDGSDRVEADQDVLFRGHGETRVLDLNFEDLPFSAVPTSSSMSDPSSVTTDLTVPSASELGLLPSNSPQAYVNNVRYAGMPLLPGFVAVLGLLLAVIGVSLLIYRRRLSWQ